jgi:hypothetical protein
VRYLSSESDGIYQHHPNPGTPATPYSIRVFPFLTIPVQFSVNTVNSRGPGMRFSIAKNDYSSDSLQRWCHFCGWAPSFSKPRLSRCEMQGKIYLNPLQCKDMWPQPCNNSWRDGWKLKPIPSDVWFGFGSCLHMYSHRKMHVSHKQPGIWGAGS